MEYSRLNPMWYYLARIHGTDHLRGPVYKDAIVEMILSGEITEATMLRYGPNTLWKPASDFNTFKIVFSRKPKPQKKIAVSNTFKVVGFLAIIVLFTLVSKHFDSNKSASSQHAKTRAPQYAVNPNIKLNDTHEKTITYGATRDGIIQETNKVRQENGLPPVIENALLNQIASERLDDMFNKQYFAHISPSGVGETEIAQRIGYRYKRLSENIAQIQYATNEKFLNGWMQSPGHRRNILDNEVIDIGVAAKKGFFKGNETWMSVQIFGLQSPPVMD